jgi:hypothetical protein
MGFFCLFGGPIANRIGLKWTLVLGAVGYPVYSAGLYTNNRYVCFCSAHIAMAATKQCTGKCLVRSCWRCRLRCIGWIILGLRRSRCPGLPSASQAWAIHEHLACLQNRRSYLGRCHPSCPQSVSIAYSMCEGKSRLDYKNAQFF